MNNVLYIGPDHSNHRGGIGAVLAVYAAHIRPFKFIPTYITSSYYEWSKMYFRAIFSLIHTLITDRAIQIVHIHTSSRGSFARKSLLVLISKLFRKKVILHIHGSEFHIFHERSGLAKGYNRLIMRKCDAVICLSQKWREYISQTFKIKHLAVINNVVEKGVIPENPPAKNGVINFLFLGLIGKRKGIFDLLKVLEKNQEAFKNRYVLTIGGNGDVNRLKEEIAAHHPSGSVRYAGWVEGPRKRELLQQCDVYVLPSYNEGLPISILEALSYGKPVISTNVGGTPEIVRPGVNGWLMEPGDHAALGSILEEAMKDRCMLDRFGTNSLQISKDYNPEAVIRSLEELYRSMLEDDQKDK